MTDEENKNNWSQADKDGNINIPDELDRLFNSIGMQLRFHTISGKNEIQTVVDMVYIAQRFFNKNPSALKAIK